MAAKSAPQMKPGAGGLKANTRDDVSKQAYGKGGKAKAKVPPKRPGMTGDNPRKPSSPFGKGKK
jgi:hypothetical protein